MKGIRCISLLMIMCLLLALAGCGSNEGAVFVQPVSKLMGMGGIAPGDRFIGMVVSENVTEIKKDNDKTVESLMVREGDDVKEGQELFAYDTEELQLSLDKLRLEKEQLEANIANYKDQIAQLEKDRNRANARDKLQYTIQIQTNQLDQKEAELNLKTKEAEVTRAENLLENATVVSPVNGRVTSVSETGMDQNGNPMAFITIQQTGAYRVKGVINELQRGGILEGDRVRMESRTDSSVFWMGTVTLVDYENPVQGNNNGMGYGGGSDEMSSSSKYPFYVEVDSIEGMLLGQHLYLSLDSGEEENAPAGLPLSSAFVCFAEDGSAYVWADNGHGKLEKRNVVLGEYDEMRDTYEILEGLSESDYVAFPDPEICAVGVPTTRTQEAPEGGVE